MTEKTSPPDKYASCPFDGKVLDYYDGQFEAVYVLLHPFLIPNRIDKDRFCLSKWPSKHEIINGCDAVTWKRILELTGLNSISNIDVGLRTSIGSLKKKYSNTELENALNALFESDNIVSPSEGDIAPLIENRLYKAIKSIGYEWLWLGDEFAGERKLHWIDDLFEKDEIPCHGTIFTHDHSLLVTSHWDSHCSLLCSTRETIESILKFDDFEGFYCTPNTEVFWGLS